MSPSPNDHIEQVPVDETTRPDDRVVDFTRAAIERNKRRANEAERKRQTRRQTTDDTGPEAA